ncbi:DUF4258 domain-containing protein [Foetidibacter luteolus]|uniref:DUF4258 domain-containing protein n=1 Tax=Foetidibacter luteolus TaxID=2608880 RepID=UPI001A98564A|nr:DUF4258 domain-containing protein [Foetidibacter luteolus]
MNFKKAFPYIVLLLLAIAVVAIKRCNQPDTQDTTTPKPKKKETADNNYQQRGLNRNPSHINYSKHARCRMGCRHIDEKEVMEILKDGKINYRKSELDGAECRKKYAVEGYSHDNQHLRIIFAPCNDEVTVVTCIDLENEFDCDCN